MPSNLNNYTDEALGDPKTDNLFVGSVAKAFRVLEAFSRAKPMMGFSQIARETGLEKSAAQRSAHTLYKLGYLEKVGRDGEYRLSKKCLLLSQSFLESHRIVAAAKPYLKFLRKKTNASINLTLLDGADTFFAVRYTHPEMLSNELFGGLKVPAYCSATGIAMYSALPEDEVLNTLKTTELKPVMPNTVWDIDDIIKRVNESRVSGFVVGIEEDFASDITIACPIFDAMTNEVGAIGASYSSEYINAEAAILECKQLIVSAANEITNRLKTT
jgi:DNA-binding IclR family transcriptional regulator